MVRIQYLADSLILLGVLTLGMARADDAGRAGLEIFERQVRPVLVEQCQGCHGAKKQESGFRVDSREALLRGGDNGPAIVPGKPDESLLIEALRRTGPIQMPPERKLPPEQVEAFAAWIRLGAPWPQETARSETKAADKARTHWAFQPISNPPLPMVRDVAWPRDPLDFFVLAKLEARQLAPAPQADPRTLLRRLSFDLVGLPPAVEELDDLVARFSPPLRLSVSLSFLPDGETEGRRDGENAYDALVDRLLASPRYGERWARHWLDVARYADTKGYLIFGDREYPWAYTYRDYVIRALNDDLSYDRFLTEQLAADLIDPPVEPRSLAALGFLTVGPRFIDNQHDIIDDRIDVVCRGLMGLTVGCARCHDHKYDPIPSRDYYSLYGVFANCVEPIVPPLMAAPPQTEGYREFAKELAAREQKLADFVRQKHEAVVDGARRRVAEYLLAAHAQRGQPRQDDFMLLSDEADLNPTMIIRWQAYLEKARLRRDPVFVAWHRLGELKPEEFESRRDAVLAELQSWSATAAPVGVRIVRKLIEQPPKNLNDVAQVYGTLFSEVDKRWCNALAVQPHLAAFDDEADEALRQVLYADDSPPRFPLNPAGDLELIPDRKSQGMWRELLKSIEEYRAKGIHAPPRAMTLVDLSPTREQRVFLRGNPNNLGESAPRQFLGLLSGDERKPFTRGSGRLELARAIVDPRNPLTARVIVNRVWMHHFGQPLAPTPSDFGLQSEPPTHPELLDHLATRFIAGGWSLKQLHRWIVGSATYRMSAECGMRTAEWIANEEPRTKNAFTPHSAFRTPHSIDPTNKLYWHFPRRRLDFEQSRDALAFVSGRFDAEMGGPSIRGLVDGGSRRRTIYAHLDRFQVPGLFRSFDFPMPDSTSPRRDATTVAPQALFWMNHKLVSDVAGQILDRPEVRAADFNERLRFLHRLLYTRDVEPAEVDLARQYLGEKPTHAQWRQYVHSLLMANEFVYVD